MPGSHEAHADFRDNRIDFAMCNPPFYESAAELEDLARAKSRPPRSACTGAYVEMVTPGGEVAFVRRMIEESVVLGKRVRWYSTMLGKLSSLERLVPVLAEHQVRNWAVTEFVQGGKTRRWALAWSWFGVRPPSVAKYPLSLTIHADRDSLFREG